MPDPANIPTLPKTICSVDGCTATVKAIGLCGRHYQRNAKYGSPLGGGPSRRPPPAECSVAGCDQSAVSRGWCPRHYRRFQRYGDPVAGDRYVGSPIPRCKVEGCDTVAKARGLCELHYGRLRHTGTTDPPAKRPRGLNKAQIVAWETAHAVRDGECLLSTNGIAHYRGYSRVGLHGRLVGLHRIALEVSLGRDLSPDEYACHRCHRRACFNPDHLYAGSAYDNTHDTIRAGRDRYLTGEQNKSSKLTDAEVDEIRHRYAAGGITQDALGVEYGVRGSAISRIVNRKRRA